MSTTTVVELAPVATVLAPHLEQEPENITQLRQVYPSLSASRALAIYVTTAGITFVCSMTTGCLTTGTPDIAAKLSIPEGLILWPSAITSLTSGCTFILVGAVADIVGPRKVYLSGCVFMALTVLACGFARTGVELIVYRGLQGIAVSCCLPTAMSLLSKSFAPGAARTRGLAIQGASYPLGYSVGLFLGGLFVDTIGWRWAWYLTALATTVVLAAGLWAIPSEKAVIRWVELRKVDWIGAGFVSGCLGLVSYALATLSSATSNIKQAQNIAILVVGLLLGPIAGYWMRRENALIPNSIWTRFFSVICAMLFLASVTLISGEVFFSLFLQRVKHLSALQASIRFLPEIVISVLNSYLAGAVLHRISTYPFVMALALLSILAPLFMGLMRPEWPYWYMEFWAMAILPVAADVLFVVGAVITTDVFPVSKQALAGSVFNTVWQIGSAVGLGVMSVAANVVTESSSKPEEPALLEGYRATFWACFGASALYCAIGAVGLRGIGKIGYKAE